MKGSANDLKLDPFNPSGGGGMKQRVSDLIINPAQMVLGGVHRGRRGEAQNKVPVT